MGLSARVLLAAARWSSDIALAVLVNLFSLVE